MKGFLVFLAASVAFAAPREYPLFKQCDPRWGSNEMGVKGNGERATICKEGCAMTSVSMALAGLGVPVPEEPSAGFLRGLGLKDTVEVTPATMNSWLEKSGGYECIAGDCNNLVLNKPCEGNLSGSPLELVGEVPPPPFEEAVSHLQAGDRVYLMHVRDRSHFVLALGPSGTAGEMLVNDPFFNTTAYNWSTVSDVIEYKVLPSTIPFPMPLFKQCNSSWANDKMGTDTICEVGCLMSSISMSLRGRDIPIPDQGPSNPATLNAWLRANNGYDNNDLKEEAIPNINPKKINWDPNWGMHRTNDIPLSQIQSYLRNETIVTIANVMHGDHFVLVVGWEQNDADALIINDPGFSRSTYSYKDDVVGWRLFTMTPP